MGFGVWGVGKKAFMRLVVRVSEDFTGTAS